MTGMTKVIVGIVAAVLASLVAAGIVQGIGSTSALGQRVAVVEAHYQDLAKGQDRIERSLGDLAGKLDRALQPRRP